MKGCTIAFVIIGTILTIVVGIIGYPAAKQLNIGWFYILLIILSTIFGIIGLVTLGNNTKSIFIGIMLLLFNGLIGGILYLCWDPYKI